MRRYDFVFYCFTFHVLCGKYMYVYISSAHHVPNSEIEYHVSLSPCVWNCATVEKYHNIYYRSFQELNTTVDYHISSVDHYFIAHYGTFVSGYTPIYMYMWYYSYSSGRFNLLSKPQRSNRRS